MGQLKFWQLPIFFHRNLECHADYREVIDQAPGRRRSVIASLWGDRSSAGASLRDAQQLWRAARSAARSFSIVTSRTSERHVQLCRLAR